MYVHRQYFPFLFILGKLGLKQTGTTSVINLLKRHKNM